jgi:hypothetical protein
MVNEVEPCNVLDLDPEGVGDEDKEGGPRASRDGGRMTMQATEMASRIALTIFAARQLKEPSARGLRGLWARASRAMSEMSLMTNPNADEAAMKMRRIPSTGSGIVVARSAPKWPARMKRIP